MMEKKYSVVLSREVMCDDLNLQVNQWAAEQWMGEALKLRKERDDQKEDIRFLLKCIVTDPTEGMGMERNDPARVHFRARLDGIRKKVT